MLLVALAATGCGSALHGAGVVGPGATEAGAVTVTVSNGVSVRTKAPFGGAANLVPNGSFEAGTSPWVAFTGSKLTVTNSVHRFGRIALLVRPKRKSPVSLGAALVDLAARPARGSRYAFTAWVKASPHGALARVQLSVLKRPKTWVPVAEATRPVTGGWQRLSVRGKVRLANGAYLRALVSINRTITPDSRLAIDGVRARILSPGRSRP
jgi:Carbohydrate binding domain